MVSEIHSDAIHSGRNPDLGVYRDDRFVRCARCGFINNLDRELHLPEGSRAGWGFDYTTTGGFDFPNTTFDSASVIFDDDNSYNVDREVYTGGCKFCGTLLYNR